MSRYIDAEAFKEHLHDLKKQVNDILPGTNIISSTSVSELVDRFPAADVAEVRHGRWIDARYPFSKCNQCGAYMDTVNNEANYCCVCGAKMDEVEKPSPCETCYIAQNYNIEDDDTPCRDCGEMEEEDK